MKSVLFFLLISATGFAQKEASIRSGNSIMAYRTFGEGKPLLIINGGPGMNSDGFSYVAHELSRFGYQSITYDQRGTGKSKLETINSETVTMDLMAQDMENLRKHLNIQKWTVLGHSFGGLMAAYYTSKYPEHVEKLILSSSGGINLKFRTYVQERLNNNLTSAQRDSLACYQKKMDNGDTSRELRVKRANFLANAYVYDKSNAPIIAERLTQTQYQVNALVFENLTAIKFDCADSFKTFKQPVLVLQGKNDIISTETAQEIAKAFPNSKLVLMENCGHYGWLDAKEVYFNAINSFLKS